MRLLVECSYNGKDFMGFQYQHHERTVQGEIESMLKHMHKTPVRIHPASRTDRGVHANQQYFHFDTSIDIRLDKWKDIMNHQLPGDILIKSVQTVSDDFHARYHTTGKTYRYKVYTSKDKHPFYHGLMYHEPSELNITKMTNCMEKFIGTHDFTSFSSAKASIDNKVRNITRFTLEETEYGYDFVISGSGFLYNMVRIIVAYVLEVGKGRREDETLEIIAAQDRTRVPILVDGSGLYLEEIRY